MEHVDFTYFLFGMFAGIVGKAHEIYQRHNINEGSRIPWGYIIIGMIINGFMAGILAMIVNKHFAYSLLIGLSVDIVYRRVQKTLGTMGVVEDGDNGSD